VNVLNLLIDHGADVSQIASDNFCALWVAVHVESLDCVKCLIERGANVDQMDQDGRTALFLASQNGNLEIVNFFWSRVVQE
jgi:ankyrin repeat protein